MYCFGMPEHHARRFFLRVEKVELLAKLAVIALFRLLETEQVRIEVLFLRPGGAVHPLQHFVLRIAAPVGAGNLEQLEDLELARRRHVGTAAEVREVALGVQRDRFGAGNRSYDLRLVLLALLAKEVDGPFAVPYLALDLDVAFGDFAHALFNGGEVFRRERAFVGKIVVETVLDDRTDSDLCVRIQLLDRMGQQVRRRMAQDVDSFGILVRNDGKIGVVVHHERRIDQFAIDLARQRGSCKARAYGRSHFGHADWLVEGPGGSVWQSYGRHFYEFPKQKSAENRTFSDFRLMKKGLRNGASIASCKFGNSSSSLSRKKLVGAIGFEPTTPTMSR